MDNTSIAEIIFPDITCTAEEYEKEYPKRNLPDGACVTRFAPSPTGFVHIGNFMPALIDYIMAKSTNGVFFLRTEDTDKKREVESASRLIMETLEHFGIMPDEYEFEGKTVGNYAPYIQSERKDIYRAFLKKLVTIGRAYPCFCTHEDMEKLRAKQESEKLCTGYYGEFAACRNLSNEERAERIRAGESFVLRFRSEGDSEKYFTFNDAVKGKLEFPENVQDLVVMKSDNGLPTYHFAHVVDDTLMRTTHVVRGEEWLSSAPGHIEMFHALGFAPPVYVHNSLILKRDEENPDCVRKISKRKDPEALMDFYTKKGYPASVVVDVVMMIINSNYEEWRAENPDTQFTAFPFSTEKMSVSGAFFDLAKLNKFSREVISRMTKDVLFEDSYKWAKEYDAELTALIEQNPDYYKDILNIEREQPKPRKDIACYSEITEYMWYMYDEAFESREKSYQWADGMTKDAIVEILDTYLDKYITTETQANWFAKIKEMCTALGYASEMKAYKKNPGNYRGSLADVVAVLRVAVTSLKTTFDLYSIMRLLGKGRIQKRVRLAAGDL